MPRSARKESKTGYYHVIMRGNNRNWIFSRVHYKLEFLNLLKKQEEDGLIEIAAWCIMDNHVHIILKADIKKMSLAIKKINIKFAMKYNQKEKTIGHVFQDRFKSEPIETDKYLLQVLRYVHNNPVKAKMVKSIKEYKWSSYNSYFSNKEIKQYKQISFILSYFDNNMKQFTKFHLETDNNEYLEIKEDLEKSRNENAQSIISSYCNEKGVTNLKQIKYSERYINEIIENLIRRSRLSLRSIASFLEIPYSMVQQANQHIEED